MGMDEASQNHTKESQMTVEFGFSMLIFGMTCILIGAVIVWYVINEYVLKKDDDDEME